jgi:NADH-quinone oxidoreductase subunit G
MTKMVKLTIDGHEVEAPEGTMIVDAAKIIGIDIPIFCYHPKMEPVGMCRMCLVEIGRPVRDRDSGEFVRNEDGSVQVQIGPKLETACTTPISEGMQVINTSDRVKAGREDILEFLLTSHPLDCPICDKGGECPLQNLTMGFGPGVSRFIYDEKFQFPKHVPLGELIMLDRERCIQCARCTRFQDELVGEPVIGFFQRGRALEIVTFSDPGFDSYFSGNTTDICPVGALTTVDFRFEARPWELKAAASICTQCPVGCNTTLNTRREARAGGEWVVKRVMPRQNEWVNEIWICDKGRFAYHYAQSPQRLTHPLARKNGELVQVGWDEAYEIAAEGMRQAGQDLLVLGSGRLSNEDAFNLRLLAEGVGGQAALYSSMAGGDQAAQVGVGTGTNFLNMGADTAILVVASDLQEEAPIWWLRVKQAVDRGAKFIVLNPRPTKLDLHATQIIRYHYGSEAGTVLALVNALLAKRPDLGPNSPPTGMREEIEAAARAFAEAQNGVIFFGSEGLGLEGTAILAQACANLLVATNHTGRPDNGLIPVWDKANSQGAWDMGLQPPADMASAIQSAKAVYLAAADPAGDSADFSKALGQVGFVVVQELFMTETARMANVILPAQAFTEREGSYTSGERRVQRFYPALPPRPLTKADFAITAQLGKLLGADIEGRSASLILQKIAGQVSDYKGISFQNLAQVEDQWPIMGRDDLYYGGTTYGNKQGLGVKLAPAAERGENTPLAWKQPPENRQPENGLLAVPITRLYDCGQTVVPSKLLKVRTPEPYIALNPSEATRLNLKVGDRVNVLPSGANSRPHIPTSYLVEVRLDENVPSGIALAPRSMGLGIMEPTAVDIRRVETEPV